MYYIWYRHINIVLDKPIFGHVPSGTVTQQLLQGLIKNLKSKLNFGHFVGLGLLTQTNTC